MAGASADGSIIPSRNSRFLELKWNLKWKEGNGMHSTANLQALPFAVVCRRPPGGVQGFREVVGVQQGPEISRRSSQVAPQLSDYQHPAPINTTPSPRRHKAVMAGRLRLHFPRLSSTRPKGWSFALEFTKMRTPDSRSKCLVYFSGNR